MIDPSVLAAALESMVANPNWRRFSLDKESADLCATALRSLLKASDCLDEGMAACAAFEARLVAEALPGEDCDATMERILGDQIAPDGDA